MSDNDVSGVSSNTTNATRSSSLDQADQASSVDQTDSTDESTSTSQTKDEFSAGSTPDEKFQKVTSGKGGPVDNAYELRTRHSKVWGWIENDISEGSFDLEDINEDNFKNGNFLNVGTNAKLGFENLSAKHLGKLLENPAALKQSLEGALSSKFENASAEQIQAKADLMVEQAKEKFALEVRGKIADKAVVSLKASKMPLETINESSESRRAFLAGLAKSSGDADEIASRLQQLGMDADNAKYIGDVCAEAHDQGLVDDLKSGEAGRDRSWWPSGGQFAEAEEALKESLDSTISNVDDLIQKAEMASFEKDKIPGGLSKYGDVLTAPDFKMARQAVFNEMGMVGLEQGYNEKGVGAAPEIMSEEIEEARANAATRENISTGINVGVAVLTAPIGGPAGMALSTAGIAESGMQTFNRYREAERTEVAAELGLTDAAAVRDADAETAATAAAGVAGVLMDAGGEIAEDGAKAYVEMAFAAEGEAIKEHVVSPSAERIYKYNADEALESSIQDKLHTSNLRKD